MAEDFSIAARLQSFRYAGRGLYYLLRDQHNARLHLLATLLVVGAGLLLSLTRTDWVLLLLLIALVWTAEMLNTALEYLADAAVPERHPLIERSKDIAAAAVLVCAVFAALGGLLIFLPYVSF